MQPLPLGIQSTTRSFERLYRAHVGDVYRYALAVTGNAEDAEDVTQTTFMNAYRALERGERPLKSRNWLIAIAHNVCRQRFRQKARRPKEVAYVDEDVAETLVPRDDSPTAADIQRALTELPLNQREALVMRELEGRSYADISEMLGISLSAVETLLFRARRALREQLEGTLSCSEAEAALSLQLDGRLARGDAAQLRAHLRACETCRSLSRRQRAQRKGIQALAVVPLPSGLASAFGGAVSGGGAAGVGAGIAAKVAAVTLAAAVAGGGGYTLARHETGLPRADHRSAAASTGGARVSSPNHPSRPGTRTPPRHGHARLSGSNPGKGRAAVAAAAAAGPASSPPVGAGVSSRSAHPAHPAPPAHSQQRHGGTARIVPKTHGRPPTQTRNATAKPNRSAPKAQLPSTARGCRSGGPVDSTTITDTTGDISTTTDPTVTTAPCATSQSHGKGGSSNHP